MSSVSEHRLSLFLPCKPRKKTGVVSRAGFICFFNDDNAGDPHTREGTDVCERRRKGKMVVCSTWCLVSTQTKPEENLKETEKKEERKRSLTPNVHKTTQTMHLPPTLINLSACKAALAHWTPPKLVLFLQKRKLSLLIDSILY